MAKRVAVAGPVEGPWALPDGWRWERLGDVCEPSQYGWTTKAASSGHIKFLRTTDISSGRVVWATVPFCTDEPSELDRYRVKAGDILISRAGSVGKSFLIDSADDAVFASYLIRFRPLSVPRYIYQWLQTDTYWSMITENTAGIAIPNVNASKLSDLPMPMAPEHLRERIVARIDELFAEIDNGEEALARAHDDLATWREALLKAAVTGKLTADWRAANPPTETGADLLKRILVARRAGWEAEPKNKGKRYKEPLAANMDALPALPEGWTWASFDQLVDQLSNGISAKPAHMPPGIPILRISSVRPMLVRDDQRRWLPADFAVGGTVAKQGDLLFTRYNGNPDLVGVCGRYRGETPIAYPDKVMCASLSSTNDTVGDFLELAMNAGASRKHIAAYTKTSAGQHGVAGSTVKVTPVPIPPEAELEHIVELYRDATTQAEHGWSDANELSVVSSTLRQSILAAAFRGELA